MPEMPPDPVNCNFPVGDSGHGLGGGTKTAVVVDAQVLKFTGCMMLLQSQHRVHCPEWWSCQAQTPIRRWRKVAYSYWDA